MSSENSNFKEVIARALGPVAELLNDPTISEVLINGPFQVFVERAGKLELTKVQLEKQSAAELAEIIIDTFAGQQQQ